MTPTADAAVVGSGLNGLVAAAYLARAGAGKVDVFERNPFAGGTIVTEELADAPPGRGRAYRRSEGAQRRRAR